jgi:succinyl-diaminopimelate desuccinylase
VTTDPHAAEDRLAERLADRTLELCRIPSPTGAEGPLCDHLERWAADHFDRGSILRRGNSLVLGRAGTGEPGLALLAHLDTVPSFPGDGGARRAGPRIHGKGASDMKGGLAVALQLIEALPPTGPRPLLVLYEREEGPYLENGLEQLLGEKLIPKVGLAICLEPTDNAVQLGCVGTLHARVRFRGKSAHSARPWEGDNAIHKAGALLSLLADRAPLPVEIDGLVFQEVLSATRAEGGRARNVVPDLFELNLNYRFAPGRSLGAAQEEIRRIVGPGPEIEFLDLSPSGPSCRGNPLVQRLLKTGVRAEPKQAWTDVARLALHGIDAINFGPGQTAQAHQVDEWAEVAALGVAYRALHHLIADP